MINSKMLGMLVAAFVAGSFVASPELRAYAANTVFSTDIVDGQVKTADLGSSAVTAAKIKDGEVNAAEIATDAVGAAEIQGVTKLLFAKCLLTSTEGNAERIPGGSLMKSCNIAGLAGTDQVVATFNNGNSCFAVASATTVAGVAEVFLRNVCPVNVSPGANSYISVIVYHK